MVYRQASTPCPLCGVPLEARTQLSYEYQACPRCRGKWVSLTVLSDMFRDMQWGAAPDFTACEAGKERARRCPDCNAEMAKALLESLIVDVCEGHGVWFDDLELQQALERVGTGNVLPDRRPEAFAPLLQQFFDGKLRG